MSTPIPPFTPVEPTIQGFQYQPMVIPEKKPNRTSLMFAGFIVTGLVAGAAGGAVGFIAARETLPAATSVTATSVFADSPSLPADGSIADVAAAVQPAVVQLNVNGAEGEGTGSGFIISSDGYIITNNHVAGSATENGIDVLFADGSTAKGKLVGANAGYDLAVVKVDKTGLKTVPLGKSSTLRVGDTVIALGSPLGLQGTVTSGIVSSLNRPVTAGNDSFINAIQTDAAINPGNSGGPLVNGNGAVVGVNSAIASLATGAGEAGSIGLGFSIPIDTAKRIADEIIKTGSAATPIIGVQLAMNFEGPGGKVSSVTKGGAADQAGVQVGDVITKINGQLISDGTQLIVTVRSFAPGDRVQLTIKRGGQTVTLPLNLTASKA